MILYNVSPFQELPFSGVVPSPQEERHDLLLTHSTYSFSAECTRELAHLSPLLLGIKYVITWFGAEHANYCTMEH